LTKLDACVLVRQKIRELEPLEQNARIEWIRILFNYWISYIRHVESL